MSNEACCGRFVFQTSACVTPAHCVAMKEIQTCLLERVVRVTDF